MNKPHKHAALIKAWADGAEIQLYNTYNTMDGSWTNTEAPMWLKENIYRIKPTTRKYRNYLWKDLCECRHIGVTDGRGINSPEEMEQCPTFIKWLGDWQEVEV